jgi:hypothetical protein
LRARAAQAQASGRIVERAHAIAANGELGYALVEFTPDEYSQFREGHSAWRDGGGRPEQDVVCWRVQDDAGEWSPWLFTRVGPGQ